MGGGVTQLHACAAGGSAEHWRCMAEGLAGGDVCARELAAEGRSAVAVAAATRNAGMVHP